MSQLSAWISNQLSSLLGLDASGDIASYLLAMDNQDDVEEYLNELLDCDDPKHMAFVKDLLNRLSRQSEQQTTAQPMSARTGQGNKDMSRIGDSSNVNQGRRPSPKRDMVVLSKKKPESPKTPPNKLTASRRSGGSRTNFIPINSPDSQDATVITLPGRHLCVCQGHKHGLVNNCLSCGRVVCKQEGSGPCMFCGNLVCTSEEEEILSRGSKKSQKLKDSLLNRSKPIAEESDSAQKALEHKNKLINYDRTSAKRTKVIDDEADYYATESKWLSHTERSKLQQKKDAIHSAKHASRRERNITIDLAGKKILDAGRDIPMEQEEPEDPLDVSVIENRVLAGISNNQYLKLSQLPKFIPDTLSEPKDKPSTIKIKTTQRNKLRLQDKELQQVVDNGMCLSMHQPWASLLTAGIKMHEGRTWYSAHRGRLWIASTVKEASASDIESLKADYIERYGKDIEFPTNYPTGCLLGCVDVVDVLPQEEYRLQYPDGESYSPYVFICENPQELLLKFPIKGQHKIYKLEPQTHKSAKAAIQAQ